MPSSADTLKISRILHAGYVFECANTQVAFDPIFENPFSVNCHAFPDVKFDHAQIRQLKFAAVFISHYHDDHCSLESLNLLDRQTPIYIYCLFEELLSLICELGFTNVHPLETNFAVAVGPFEITPRRALDADVDSIFQIKAAGINVLNVVDSWIDQPTLELLGGEAPWHMVLWPFQTMREIEVLSPSHALPAPDELPPEWMEQLKELNPKYIVPSSCQFILESWSWYNHAFFPISYQQFKREVEKALPGVGVVRMNPSVSILLSRDSIEASLSLNWIQPVGDQDVDYDYKSDLKPPPTAEIARHFDALSSIETKRVYNYCQSELLEKFNLLGAPADIYFNKPRIWQLSVYDHKGEAREFFYRLDGDDIELFPDERQPVAWRTEIPISKLYSALECGESLTSMYMRINDVVFEPGIESAIQSVDVIDDPLARCLFNGVFGAYQKAQLKRINSLNPG
jgi:hypothetical protein